MAKEIAGQIKLQIKGGAANPSPPVGPALGSKGINIMEFCSNYLLHRQIFRLCSENSAGCSAAQGGSQVKERFGTAKP